MRNPFPSIVSLTSSMNSFTLVSDLESNIPETSAANSTVSKSRFRKRRSQTRSSSHSHQRPHTALSGASSYASAFRTPLPTLTPTDTIDLGGVNIREQDNVVFVETHVPTLPKLELVGNKQTSHFNEDEAFTANDGVMDYTFNKSVQEETGLGYGLGLEIRAFGNIVNSIIDVEKEADMRALLDKYDPGEIPGRTVWGTENHGEMVGQMLLDCILIAAGRLRRHGWIMGSQNELFREACTHERWDSINDDLVRYTNAVEAYETWQKQPLQKFEFGPLDLPLRSDRYGRVLAVIEIASKSDDPEERAVAKELSRSLMRSHATWWRSHVYTRKLSLHSASAEPTKSSILSRIAATSFGALALIVPMLIIVLQPGLMPRLVTTCLFTVAVACLLAYLMDDAGQNSLMAMAAAYAAVLVIFVGSGAGA